jgi:hypothetical protein
MRAFCFPQQEQIALDEDALIVRKVTNGLEIASRPLKANGVEGSRDRLTASTEVATAEGFK